MTLRPLTAADIHWHSDPPEPPLESRDYLMMDDHELIEYVLALQTELRLMRAMWHDTIGALTETVKERDRALWDVRRLRGGR